MAIRFTDRLKVRSVSQLSPLQREQLQAAGRAYDGEDLTAAQRLDDEGDVDTSFAGMCAYWKVVDGDTHRYDAWLFMDDSGSIFRAGTTEEVAGVIHGGLECEVSALRQQLGLAMVAARIVPKGAAVYTEFAAALARSR